MSSGTRTVTAGVDGSRAALDAADWAAREAERRRLPLRLLHAGAEPAAPAPLQDVDLPARTLLDRAAVRLSYAHPALDIVADHVETPVVPALLDAATEAEALVLGSWGATGFTGFPVGSVALAVTSASARPVVLVRAGELPEDERMPAVDGTPPHRAPYLPVVLGLDPDRPADELLAYAFETAAARSAPLHVTHTWTTPPPPRGYVPGAPQPEDAPEREEGRRRVLTSTLQPWRHKFPETTVTEHVVHGQPGPHLLKESRRAGLLVVGRRADTAGLGRAARVLVHHSACPVAVVPHR
ncbi:universal stress protein [Streptomyces sp. NPDC086783]|uniref:universal stress protein n=1 Tax=Streptomyces sp. NPDC086783 TaxID=3365758 RepID=UPI0038101270